MNDKQFFEEWEKMYGNESELNNNSDKENELNKVTNENTKSIAEENNIEHDLITGDIDIESNVQDVEISFNQNMQHVEIDNTIDNVNKNISIIENLEKDIIETPVVEMIESIDLEIKVEEQIVNKIIMENNLQESSIIKVIGVGGGGGNAVNHMFRSGIAGVEFIVCNTDAKDLAKSPVTTKIQIGSRLTEGRGAGAKPEVGKNAAIENIDEIRTILSKNTKMVFITAGMGGGTGTGAAPIIASVAKEMGILTVGIVTIPFVHEGSLKRKHAEIGIAEMRKNVDSLVIVCNDKLREMYGSLPFTQAFAKADDILATGAKAIVEIITTTGIITQDFNDVRTVMENSGTAIMGIATVDGENRAHKVVEAALSSPLLNDNNINGASQILLNITSGSQEASMDEVAEIQDYIQREAGEEANIILGLNKLDELDSAIKLIIIATGFKSNKNLGFEPNIVEEKKINILESSHLNNKLYNTSLIVEKTIETHTSNIETSKYNVSDEDGFILKKVEETIHTSIAQKIELVQEELEEKVILNTPNLFTTESTLVHQLEDELSISDELNNTATETLEEIPFEVVIESDIQTTTTYTLESEKEELQFSVFTKEIDEQTTITETQERVVYNLESDDLAIETPSKSDDMQIRNDDRAARLRNYTNLFKSKKTLSELESEPAYVRQGTVLNDVNQEQENNAASRYTLSQDENNKTEIRPNNSFLHDNVD